MELVTCFVPMWLSSGLNVSSKSLHWNCITYSFSRCCLNSKTRGKTVHHKTHSLDTKYTWTHQAVPAILTHFNNFKLKTIFYPDFIIETTSGERISDTVPVQ
jgi:hypothetical protein